MADEQKVKVIRVSTDAGVFFKRVEEGQPPPIPDPKPGTANVTGYQYFEMTAQEYMELEVSQDAKRFFEGKIVGSRADK